MSESRKEVLEQFMHLQALMHRYQARNFMNFGPWGNPMRGQGRVLGILKMKPEISQKELSYLLDMSKQSLAELLNKLEKNGYIKRETSEEDRRSCNIKLTEEGKAFAEEMDGAEPNPEKLFECLNDEEVANLMTYMQRIIERLEDRFTGNDEDFRKRMTERFKEWRGGHRGEKGDDSFGFFGCRSPYGWGGR